MTEAKAGAWTDAEKVGLYFQIIEKAGPIPWDDLIFPEGRTKKACQVMVDKEKSKVRKAREAAGEVVESTPKAKGKRKADGETKTPASSAKKAKGGKKAVEEENKDEEEESGQTEIKAEVEEDNPS